MNDLTNYRGRPRQYNVVRRWSIPQYQKYRTIKKPTAANKGRLRILFKGKPNQILYDDAVAHIYYMAQHQFKSSKLTYSHDSIYFARKVFETLQSLNVRVVGYTTDEALVIHIELTDEQVAILDTLITGRELAAKWRGIALRAGFKPPAHTGPGRSQKWWGGPTTTRPGSR